MGECLEYLLSEKIVLVLIGLAKSNKPEGLLSLGLRFMISLLTSVRSQNILAQSDTHQAIYQLLSFLYNQISNEMHVSQSDANYLVQFLQVLLLESKRCGMEKDLFLANQSPQINGIKESRAVYIPLQLILLLLQRQNEGMSGEVQESLLTHLKILRGVASVDNYLLIESDFALILVLKLKRLY